jgi:Mn-dependent DtxR family transcriptional regulator
MSGGSIDIDEFENADGDEFDGETDTERIVCFLADHDDRAWKASTIADRLDIDSDATSAILSRLKGRGLVRHKRPYWAITDDDERLRSAYQLHHYHETATEQYGEEDLDTFRTDEMERVQ